MSQAELSRFALVTGGNGWLGKRLVAALISGIAEANNPDVAGGWRVRCLVPAEEKVDDLLALGVEIVRGDIRSPEARTALLKDSEGATLFNLAGIIHPPGRTSLFDTINYQAVRNLIEEAPRLRRILVMSSNSPFGGNAMSNGVFDDNSPYNPYMGYGRSKMLLEIFLRDRMKTSPQPPITIVRAPWFYGPGQPPRQTLFFHMIRDGKMPIFGDGLNRRSMGYTDSLALGMILAAQKEEAANNIFWLADQRPYSMEEIISTVSEVLQKDFSIKVKSPAPHFPGVISDCARLADATLQSLGFYHQKIHVLSEMNMTIACSVAKANEVLGYKPLVDLREGMRRSIAWCLEKNQF